MLACFGFLGSTWSSLLPAASVHRNFLLLLPSTAANCCASGCKRRPANCTAVFLLLLPSTAARCCASGRNESPASRTGRGQHNPIPLQSQLCQCLACAPCCNIVKQLQGVAVLRSQNGAPYSLSTRHYQAINIPGMFKNQMEVLQEIISAGVHLDLPAGLLIFADAPSHRAPKSCLCVWWHQPKFCGILISLQCFALLAALIIACITWS